ncbi:MAG: ammonium transporter [Gemmataceae bacterium]
MLMSTCLVMFMLPGLALFYGGLARSKNVLGTMMHSMIALSIVGVQWVLLGYCMAFGKTQNGWIGWSPEYLGLAGVKPGDLFADSKIPLLVHCMFQGMFAIITPALISGAIAERVRFVPYCFFVLLWSVLVYNPLAHWVWAYGPTPTPEEPGKFGAIGWLGAMGAVDFAGGTVVHIAAGFSGLAAILCLRKRIGYPEHAMHPNSIVLALLGAGLLWFGWFGFNGGSGLSSGPLAATALTATQCAAASAGLVWALIELFHRGKPTGLGFATGIVAGRVAVTPASGFVSPFSSLIIGALASMVCYSMVILKPRFGYDDSLDAFGVHGIGGLLGALLTGIFASKAINSAGADGGAELFKNQVIASVVAIVYSFVITVVLVKVIDAVFGFCLTPEAEGMGLDRSEHGEVGFDTGANYDLIPEMPMAEPRAASAPPNGRNRFSVLVEGASPNEIMSTWSGLYKTDTLPTPDLQILYPYLTTVQGNRFRFRGGDRSQLANALERMFAGNLRDRKIQTKIEN